MEKNISVLARPTRTIGGAFGLYNLLPFIIEIFLKPPNSGAFHICTGSLISYDWVLTAGHCVNRLPINVYILGAGLLNNSHKSSRFGSIKFNSGQTRQSKYAVCHEDYDNKSVANDIGLIKTRVPFTEDRYISLVKLPEKVSTDLFEKYKYCYSGGWGMIGPNNMLKYDHGSKKWTYHSDPLRSSRLSHVVLPLISNKQCRRIHYGDVGFYFDVEDTNICTLYYPGRKSLCRGDSGSPLICGSMQYGISSWSFACGAPRVGADVYTRVDKYLEWIKGTMSKKDNTDSHLETQDMLINDDYYDIFGRASTTAVLLFRLIFNYILIVMIR